LTPAEVGVATLIGKGLSPQETSDHLGVSVDTVRTHLKNINLKLGLRRQGELVRLVTRLQMVK
jgi:DNA-binding CsgD family transcriptional regulator